jgi:hypothetical protein
MKEVANIRCTAQRRLNHDMRRDPNLIPLVWRITWANPDPADGHITPLLAYGTLHTDRAD